MPPTQNHQNPNDQLVTLEFPTTASSGRSRPGPARNDITLTSQSRRPSRNAMLAYQQHQHQHQQQQQRLHHQGIIGNSPSMLVPTSRHFQHESSRPSYSSLPLRSSRPLSNVHFHRQEYPQHHHQHQHIGLQQPVYHHLHPGHFSGWQAQSLPHDGTIVPSQHYLFSTAADLAPSIITHGPFLYHSHDTTSHGLPAQSPRTCPAGVGSHDDFFVPDSDYGGSFDSMHVSHPSTVMSSMSENFTLADYEAESRLQSPEVLRELSFQGTMGLIPQQDPTLTHVDFSMGSIPPMPSLEECSQQNDFIGVPSYNSDPSRWAYHFSHPESNHDFALDESSFILQQESWSNAGTAPNSEPRSGSFAFQSSPEEGFEMYLSDQEPGDDLCTVHTPQTGISPKADENELEGWQPVEVPSYPNSSIESPFEVIESPHQTPSPKNQQPNEHQHILTFYPGVTKASNKALRGRQRRLTAKEKQEARQVREAKACWACHLSKIKCSPCSQGTPCKRCHELEGKRRFCRLPCFNDPLESFCGFLVPDYLTGHFTRANVEHFVNSNATGWGTKEMTIRMTWGYWNPLEAKVFALDIRRDSQIGVHHSASWGPEGATLVKKPSPPLGIPLAAMDSLQDEYDVLVQKIVHDDLINYVAIAYDDQESELPERLLRSIATFHNASKVVGNECEPLRETLEIHVVGTILERSLVLDDESRATVEKHLRTQLPERSAARCVQRQIKLAFYLIQRQRIQKVLETLGSLMWTNSKGPSSDQRWATRFSVFLALVLVMDQTLTRGYYFSQTRVKFHNGDAAREAKVFEDHVRATYVQLFERFKEIYHNFFKTRKNGKEACNPIRDGLAAFKDQRVSKPVEMFVDDLRAIVHEFDQEIRYERSRSSTPSEGPAPYVNAGRLACLFLEDFLG